MELHVQVPGIVPRNTTGVEYIFPRGIVHENAPFTYKTGLKPYIPLKVVSA
jgi:hypothetical protein